MSTRIDNTRAGRGKPRIDAPPIPANRSEYFTAGDAGSFIAERMSPYPAERDANRNKLYGRIIYALQHKQLQGTKESIQYSNLILWARNKPDLKDAVAGLDVVVEEIIDDQANARDEWSSLTLPASTEDSHNTIYNLWSENERLREQLSAKEDMLSAANSELSKAKSDLKKQKLRQDVGKESASKQNISRKSG